MMIKGVFCGLAIWWVCLSGFISSLSINFNLALIQKINRYTGALIACLGIIVIGSAWFM